MDTPNVARSLALAGTASSLWLSGIYFSSSHLAVPLFYPLPTSLSTSAFTTFYHSGAKTVVPIALVSTICNGAAAYFEPSKRLEYGLAAVGAIGTLVWTRLAMMGTNTALIELGEDGVRREKVGAKGVEDLLRRWAWMNGVRSSMAGVAGLLGLVVAGGVWRV